MRRQGKTAWHKRRLDTLLLDFSFDRQFSLAKRDNVAAAEDGNHSVQGVEKGDLACHLALPDAYGLR
jgi:hypothetical protein